MRIATFLAVFGGLASVSLAQNSPPQLTSVSPPAVMVGGQQDWVISGHNLGRVDRIDIEGTAVSASIAQTHDRTIVANVRAEPGASQGFRAIRVEGANGISNLKVIRVDRLAQTLEHEPNDATDQATPLPSGSAGVGALSPQDVDHYRIHGTKGERVTIEVEARRLGIAVAPIVTICSADGRALAQGRETPGLDGDCRILYRFPANGAYVVQVRDNVYGSTDGSSYRLRVTAEPFVTGMFPLGGPPGRVLTVTATGGSLNAAITQSLKLSDRTGTIMDVPPFQVAGTEVLAPGRVVVADGPEVYESAQEVTPLAQGDTVNGRIDRPGEVDRYRVTTRMRQTLQCRVVATPLGSWLDSVVTVRNAQGELLAENDDTAVNTGQRGNAPPVAVANGDSVLEYATSADGDLMVEITDRYGGGGPEFGYRLTVGPPRPDFQVSARARRLLTPDFDAFGPSGTPGTGAYQVSPVSPASILCEIVHEGRTGPITLTPEGLPDGVTAAPVTVRPQLLRSINKERPAPEQAVLTLRVVPGAESVSGRFRIVARATDATGRILERLATEAVRIDRAPKSSLARPVIRRITEFPVRVSTP